MKVVDVLRNRLIEAPADCEYVALSYVYGKNQRITLPSLPYFQREDLPLTIQDAFFMPATKWECNIFGLIRFASTRAMKLKR